MVKPNEKGAEFERECAKRLSRWVSKTRYDDVFWRSAMSGGRSTVSIKAGGPKLSAHAGDLVANRKEGLAFIRTFFVECKFYKAISFSGIFFDGNVSNREEIIEKPRREAFEHGKEPFVIVKRNFKPSLLLTSSNALDLLELGCDRPGGIPLLGYYPSDDINVLNFVDTIVDVDWVRVRKVIKRREKASSLIL